MSDMEIYVIDRIIDDFVIIQGNDMKAITIKRNEIVGFCKEGNVLIKNKEKYFFSQEETEKRINIIKDLTKSLWS